MKKLHTDSINRDYEANYRAKLYVKERAYFNIVTVDCDNNRDNNCNDINSFKI